MYLILGIVFLAIGVGSFVHEGVARFVIMDNKIARTLLNIFTDGSVSEGTFRILRIVCGVIWVLLGLSAVLVGLSGG